jgi:hypothetical protein
MHRKLVIAAFVAIGLLRSGYAEPVPHWVTAHSVAGVHVRVSDFMKTLPGKQFQQALANHRVGKAGGVAPVLGVALEHIDELTLSVTNVVPDSNPGLVVLVRTVPRMNRAEILKNLGITDNDDSARSDRPWQSTYRIKHDDFLFFGYDRQYCLVFGKRTIDDLMQKLLDSPQSNGNVEIARSIGRHTLTVWADPHQFPREIWETAPAGLQPLRDSNRLIVAGDVEKDSINFAFHFDFPKPGLAADGLRALEEGRGLLRDELQKSETELARDPKTHASLLELLGEVRRAIGLAKLRHNGLQVSGAVTFSISQSLIAAVVDGIGQGQFRSHRTQSINQIKQFGLAFHNYESAYQKLPAAAICDKNGKPLLSWRVTILPFIEQETLYRQFKLDEPWDSEHNKALLPKMPAIYRLPGDRPNDRADSTYYQVFVGEKAIFQMTKSGSLVQIADGTSNTIWLTEAATAVPWTKPADIEYDPAKTPAIGYHFGDRACVGYADGSVRTIRKNLKEEILHLLIQKSDGMPIPPIDD